VVVLALAVALVIGFMLIGGSPANVNEVAHLSRPKRKRDAR
jgi:hypothetical protein